MTNLGTLKIYVCENHDGEIVLTSKESKELNNAIKKDTLLQEFLRDYDNLSDEDKIYKLMRELTLCRLDNSDLLIKNMQLKDEIKERDKKIEKLKEVIDSHFGKWKLFQL